MRDIAEVAAAAQVLLPIDRSPITTAVKGSWGPHLVVVRRCNVPKWEIELKRWCPGLKLLYFGSQRELIEKTRKLEALADLLQKLKSKGHDVLILMQIILMLDILELFSNIHFLTYIRIDENTNCEQYLPFHDCQSYRTQVSASTTLI
ncbi:SWI/SNF-related matrix-associated actin-dependent regulator of chromatin subfamily A containing DEAD/H box 1-like [Emydura macquarii macquarii]|uniref:SWI/SNF-related matrix-associated actin-dependent regulator of chromatin subfamily A containing DEAD/H box 1-like n=1 Tax=Emydura macquarii macquarii TaxID=1129001 RepID=UPI00352A959D